MKRVYEYDVFISYQHRGDVPAWIRTHFHPRLVERLDQNLDRDARVFFDEDMPAGAVWQPRRRSAFQRARILVPVCSPKYFTDEQCLAEWYSMVERENLAGAPELIYPVIFCDSQNFPVFAKERRMRSLRKWNKAQPQFQDSLAYLDFDGAVEEIAEELVELMERAPQWRSDWPTVTHAPEPLPMSRLPRF